MSFGFGNHCSTKLNYFPFKMHKKFMLLQYITELKNRIILILCSWSINVILSYYYKETLLFFTIKSLSLKPLYFITTNITEIITSYFYLSYFNATLFTFIIIFYHSLIFLSPSLYFFEFNFLKQYLIKTQIAFFFSILILNNYIIPHLWNFFLSFQNSKSIINLYFEGKLNEYIEFYIKFFILYLILNQLIISAFFFSSKIKNLSLVVKKYRKFIYVGCLLIATLCTPPDIFSQCLVFFFSIFLYELVVLLILYLKTIN